MKKRFKRLTAFALTAVMTASGFAFAADAPFTDVSNTAWYKPFVDYTYSENLFSGTSDTTFSPQNCITRAQLVTVLGQIESRVPGKKDPQSLYISPTFPDVSAGTYYYWYVGWAQKIGLVSGYPDDTFRPNEPVTREQMAVFLDSYLNLSGIKPEGTAEHTGAYLDQNTIADWAAPSVSNLTDHGLMTGDTQGNFGPKRSTTRAEAAALITRIYEEVMYPTEAAARYECIRFAYVTENGGPTLLGGNEGYKIISDYKDYTDLIAAAKAYCTDGDTLPMAEESYFEAGNLLAVELRHDGGPQYRTKLSHCVITPMTDPVVISANVTFFSRDAGGSTADTVGYLFFIEIPKDVSEINVREVHRVEGLTFTTP